MTKVMQFIRRSLSPERVSRAPLKIESSGAVRVDLTYFFASPEGKKELARAQGAWEKRSRRVPKSKT